MQFLRNIHFTSLVKAADRLREFNFKKITHPSEQLFHVDVSDDRGNRIVFQMRKEDGQSWRIVETGLPLWVVNAEKSLDEAIESELRKHEQLY